MSTDKQFNEALDSIHFDFNNTKDFYGLKKNRANLRKWLIRLRNNLIEDFELPETPDKEEVNRAKKSKKNADDVQKEVAMAFVNSKRIRDDEEVDMSDEATINEYGDIGSTHLSDVHGPEFENFAQNNPMVTNEMTVEASALSAPIEACERAEEGSDFQIDLSKEVHFLRRLFRDFNRGGTLVMKLNYPEGTDLKAPFILTYPCSVNVAITRNKAFVKWEKTYIWLKDGEKNFKAIQIDKIKVLSGKWATFTDEEKFNAYFERKVRDPTKFYQFDQVIFM
jgi:hypothetical protein